MKPGAGESLARAGLARSVPQSTDLGRGERAGGAANCFIAADMHTERCSTSYLARLISDTTARETVMPDRRRVAAKAIIAAGAYLHPNFYVEDKKLWQTKRPMWHRPGQRQ